MSNWPESRQIELSAILSRVNFCGCGTNEKWVTMRKLLKNVETHEHSFYDADDKPEDEIGFWEFAANCLDSFKLTEHGSTMHSSFLTDDGELLLEFLSKFPDGNYPDWAEGVI